MTDCTCCSPSSQSEGAELVPGELTPELERLRAAGFWLLYETGAPVSIAALAELSGGTEDETREVLEEIEGMGRARRRSNGDLVGIAGLSVEPTPHAIDIDGRTFFTWCALDAVGIFTALGATGKVTSPSPNGTGPLKIDYVEGATDSSYALFLFDGYDGGSVYESWCRHVNFFRNVDEARSFAEVTGLSGQAVPIAEISEMAESVWAPVVAGVRGREG